MSGPQFRDYHHLLDEHADPISVMTDNLAERARKIGSLSLKSQVLFDKFPKRDVFFTGDNGPEKEIVVPEATIKTSTGRALGRGLAR